mmetsp:Transcript_11400/g.31839  ORF Transcript_11400/g.31839 Transcript_11400/m.31839 type:complete len:121 (+) Transcript_11400:568-930(+)
MENWFAARRAHVGSGSLARLLAPLAQSWRGPLRLHRWNTFLFGSVGAEVGRSVLGQLRTDRCRAAQIRSAVLTAIAAYADRFMCRLRRGKLHLLAWAISRATRNISGLDAVSRRLQCAQD